MRKCDQKKVSKLPNAGSWHFLSGRCPVVATVVATTTTTTTTITTKMLLPLQLLLGQLVHARI